MSYAGLRYLTQQQAETLREWKNRFARGKDWQDWRKDHVKARQDITKLFQSGFLEGKDLKTGQLDELFRCVRSGQGGGRGVNKKLYESNGLKRFNSALRELLDEDEFLPDRFKNFLNLKNVGIWAASQILCKWYQEIHPFVALWNRKSFMEITLFNRLNRLQLERAKKDAMERYGISDKYPSDTLKYLTYAEILQEVMDVTQLDSFPEVQNLLRQVSVKKYYMQKPILKSTAEKIETESRPRRKESAKRRILGTYEIAESDDWAMRKVKEFEKSQGRTPVDVSSEKRGYDYESADKNTGDVVRYIEVKSRKGPQIVGLTNYQFKTAKRERKKYYLYVLTHDNICVIRDPATVCSNKKVLTVTWTLPDWFKKCKKFDIPS